MITSAPHHLNVDCCLHCGQQHHLRSIAKELCPGTYSQPCWLGRPQKSSAHIVPPVVCSKVCWRSTSVMSVLNSRLGCSTHSCLSRHASTCNLLHASSPASAPQRSCTIRTSIQIDMQIKHYKHGSALQHSPHSIFAYSWRAFIQL